MCRVACNTVMYKDRVETGRLMEVMEVRRGGWHLEPLTEYIGIKKTDTKQIPNYTALVKLALRPLILN